MVREVRGVCNYDPNIKLQLLISIYLGVCEQAVRMRGAEAGQQRGKDEEEEEVEEVEKEEEEWHTPEE